MLIRRRFWLRLIGEVSDRRRLVVLLQTIGSLDAQEAWVAKQSDFVSTFLLKF